MYLTQYFALCLKPTVCPSSSDPFYIVAYYIKWVTTSWTHSIHFRIGEVRSGRYSLWMIANLLIQIREFLYKKESIKRRFLQCEIHHAILPFSLSHTHTLSLCLALSYSPSMSVSK